MSSIRPLRLAIATSATMPDLHPDDLGLVAALRHLQIEPTPRIWNDANVDWSCHDAVLLRSTWDYFKHYADFIAWLDHLDGLSIATINDSALLRWNSDKRYLPELARHGVEIIPTQVTAHERLVETLQPMLGQEVVVKPTISGTAWHAIRGRVGDAAFAAEVAALPTAFAYMVQPFMAEIVSEGEWSLLFFDGRYSHAVIKRAARGDYRVQGEFGGTAEPARPDAATIQAAQRAMAAAAAIGHRDPAYARVDGVMAGGRFLLMELEMIEPYLHLGAHPGAAEVFARHLAVRLRRLRALADCCD